MATEQQHQHDLVIDQKKPHWQIVQDILTLFKSKMIYSNGQYKIITERDDLPVRQVFHAGNMSGRAEVRIAREPGAPNQMTAEFANRVRNYERDVYVLQDSASIYGANLPIKNSDVSYLGVTRPTEIARHLDFEMQRRQIATRQVTFRTSIEAVAVEPGDHCIVGVIMADFDQGYGGRVIEGSAIGFVGDREAALNPGSLYDLWLWHTDADTPEKRTLVGSTTQAYFQPTAPFSYAAQPTDRWAIGVQSEDLILAVVRKVDINQNGNIEIVADEYVPITIRQDCPDTLYNIVAPLIPSQPTSVTFAASGCLACFQATFTSCQGGLTSIVKSSAWWSGVTTANAFFVLKLDSSMHPPVESVLVGNTISFVSGANSGRSSQIYSYSVNGSQGDIGVAMFETQPFVVASGTAYYVSLNTCHSALRVDISTDGINMNPLTTVFADSACVEVQDVSTLTYIRPVPVNANGTYNQAGTWVFSMPTFSCFDLDVGPTTSPFSITTQSVTAFLSTSLPGSVMEVLVPLQMRAIGLVNDTCASGEITKISFGLRYVSSTIINSLVIDLRNAASQSVGSDAAFTLKATFTVMTVPSTSVRATLEYLGPAAGLTTVSTQLASGVMSINFNTPQSMGFTAIISHVDTAGAVHSHGCHSIVLDHAEFELLGTGAET